MGGAGRRCEKGRRVASEWLLVGSTGKDNLGACHPWAGLGQVRCDNEWVGPGFGDQGVRRNPALRQFPGSRALSPSAHSVPEAALGLQGRTPWMTEGGAGPDRLRGTATPVAGLPAQEVPACASGARPFPLLSSHPQGLVRVRLAWGGKGITDSALHWPRGSGRESAHRTTLHPWPGAWAHACGCPHPSWTTAGPGLPGRGSRRQFSALKQHTSPLPLAA